jgi:hypothetical protein
MANASLYIKDLSLDSNHFKNLSLSIQLKLGGFSFSIFNSDLHKHVALVDYHNACEKNPLALIELMNEVFENEKLLKLEFTNISVNHHNNLATLVPTQLFDADKSFDYLNFNHKLLESEFVTHDIVEELDLAVVYSPFVEVNDWLLDKFGEFEYKHCSTVLLENYFKSSVLNKQKRFFLNYSPKQIDICVIEDKKLQFFNSFKINTADDFVYFVMFVFEQLQLDANEQTIELSGDLKQESEAYLLLHRYVTNIEVFDFKSDLNLSHEFEKENINGFFSLLKNS